MAGQSYAGAMALAVLVAYQSSGTGWVGWVVLAVIVAFIAVTLIGDFRRSVLRRIKKWRTRRQDRSGT
jgi:hypothetical protein